MRSTNALASAVLLCAGGLILVPALNRASATQSNQFKQIGIALLNYNDIHGPVDLDRLLSNSGDALPGLLLTERDEVVEVVAFQRRDNDLIFIQLDSGETVPAMIVWSDVHDFVVMDADGGVGVVRPSVIRIGDARRR